MYHSLSRSLSYILMWCCRIQLPNLWSPVAGIPWCWSLSMPSLPKRLLLRRITISLSVRTARKDSEKNPYWSRMWSTIIRRGPLRYPHPSADVPLSVFVSWKGPYSVAYNWICVIVEKVLVVDDQSMLHVHISQNSIFTYLGQFQPIVNLLVKSHLCQYWLKSILPPNLLKLLLCLFWSTTFHFWPIIPEMDFKHWIECEIWIWHTPKPHASFIVCVTKDLSEQFQVVCTWKKRRKCFW